MKQRLVLKTKTDNGNTLKLLIKQIKDIEYRVLHKKAQFVLIKKYLKDGDFINVSSLQDHKQIFRNRRKSQSPNKGWWIAEGFYLTW